MTFPPRSSCRKWRGCAADRLLIETDSPFLAPVPFRNKGRNEPAFVTRVAEVIAELRGATPAAIGDAARANFERVFKP